MMSPRCARSSTDRRSAGGAKLAGMISPPDPPRPRGLNDHTPSAAAPCLDDLAVGRRQLLDMVQPGAEQIRNVVVVDGVHAAPSVPLSLDQLMLAQHPQLMRDRRLLHPQRLDQLAD